MLYKKYDLYGPQGLIEPRQEFQFAQHRRSPARSSTKRIMYNRIPKCGSSTVLHVFKSLGNQNHFSFLMSMTFNQLNVSYDQEKALVHDLEGHQTPWIYNRHVQFIDFTAHDLTMPDYINLFRDPVDRLRSHFYFGFPQRENMTFDECVAKEIPNCIDPGTTLQYFCSSSDHCWRSKKHRDAGQNNALQVAKRNVARYYKVVGITEEMESFFALLEYNYPDLFQGAVEVYRNTTSRNVDEKKSSHPLKPSTRAIMQRVLKYEVEFYSFVKQRFHSSLREARIGVLNNRG